MPNEKPWERQPGESAKAFAAFVLYRDLAADVRSLNAAYSAGLADGQAHRAPGLWASWSSEGNWVERAAAYDGHLDAQRRIAREKKLRELEERRAQFEFRSQDLVERRVGKIEELLNKADQAPVVEVKIEKNEAVVAGNGELKNVKTVTRVKGIPLGQYARLVRESRETQRQAILGVRPAEAHDNGTPGGAVRATFEWIPPAEPAAGPETLPETATAPDTEEP